LPSVPARLQRKMQTDKDFSATTLAAVVALIFIAAAVVVGLAVGGGINESSTPFVSQILLLIGVVVPVLVGAKKAEKASYDLRNGLISDKIKPAIHEALEENTTLFHNQDLEPLLIEAGVLSKLENALLERLDEKEK
jgi:hypothetical protein